MTLPLERIKCLCAGAIAAMLCLTSAGAAAADEVVVAAKAKQIEVFALPDDAKPGQMVAVAGLPWPVKEERNSFYRVTVNGKDGWIDAMQVSVARSSSDACPLVGQARVAQPASVAGAPGAGPSRCK